MEWIFLIIVAVAYIFQVRYSYSDFDKTGWEFFAVNFGTSVFVSLIWYWVCRNLDKEKLYVYSLTWDTMVTCLFYFAPILLCGMKIDRWGVVGMLMMIAGLAVIKFRTLG